jgi:hypothetical protein
MRKPLIVPILLLAGAVACGRGGESRTSYQRKADAICKKTNTQVQAATARPATSYADYIATLRRVNDITRSSLTRLQALPTPRGDTAVLKRQYDAVRQGLEAGEQSIEASERGDASAAQAANARRTQLLAEANRAAADYGLIECAK